MRLYLVRHGEAVSKEQDPSRPLTPRGRADAARTARFLAQAGVRVRAIRHSEKRRARETAEELAREVRSADGAIESPGLKPNDPVAPLAEELAGGTDDLVLVGHLPHLAKLASLLLVGREWPPAVDMEKGGLVCLERGEPGGWRIVYSIPPGALGSPDPAG